MKNKIIYPTKQNGQRCPGVMIVLFLLVMGLNVVSAQSIYVLENRLNILNHSYNKESGTLDSLRQVLNERAREIDIAKKKKNVDESSIKQIMSSTVTVSNRIDEHQKIFDSIEKDRENVKRLLGKKYSAEIDSLSRIEKSDKYEGNKDEIKSRILTLTGKRILVSPQINLLSFNPEKMLEVNLLTAQSDEERKIYFEYLKGALDEVNDQLGHVKKMNEEVKQIISLQQKTKRFLEETEFDLDIRTTNLTTPNLQNDRSTNITTTFGSSELTAQAPSVIFLIRQLDLKQTPDLKTRNKFTLDSAKKELSIKEYKELLDELEKRLIDYRLILTNKINAAK